MSIRTPLARVRGLGSAKSGAEHWWRQRLTAIANVPLVLFTAVLVVSLLGRSHADVIAVLGHPLVAVGLIAAILSITYHMRLGMQVIIEDYVHDEGAKVLALVANTFFAAAVALVGVFAVMKLSLGA